MFKLEKYQNEINSICQKYHVKSLTIFGSALSDNFNDSSDIDFLIELDNADNGIKRYMNVKFELERLFTRSVDLVMPKAIKNSRIKNYIFSNVKEIYAA
ncbi:MAG: nucleotidyltransferase family protein [Methanosarcinaceae archaeon]